MLTTEFAEHVSADLSNLGEVGGSDVAKVVARLVRAMEPALTVRFLEAVTELVAECQESGGPQLAVSIEGARLLLRGNGEGEPSSLPATGELTSRFALRVTEDMKGDIERRSSDEGISINSWIVRAIDRALTPPMRPPSLPGRPRRIKGAGRA